jgi:hypothetical protein
MDLGPLDCHIEPRLTCLSQELSRYPCSAEEKVPPHLVQDAHRLLVCLFTTIVRGMIAQFPGCRFMQSRTQSGEISCSTLYRGSIKGVSLEWGEEGERVKIELVARIPLGIGNGMADSSGISDHTSVDMIYRSKEHQNRWAEVCQEARTSYHGARHQRLNLRTLSVEKLYANLAKDLYGSKSILPAC